MEKDLHSSPVLSFSEDAAKKIFDQPKKEIPAKIRWAKIKKVQKKDSINRDFYDNI